MHFPDVALAGIGVSIPTERITSEAIESRLSPLYQRLRLPEGRLALMSGIASRRIWPAGTVPSGPSITTGESILASTGVPRAAVGALIHASVCRDFLEPATASRVHHELGLSSDCWVYDVSNACLGVLNGAVQIANMIQSGMITAGLVVGTENSRPLIEGTIAALNADTTLTRRTVKPAFASLTIGSGSCGWLLCHRDLMPDATPIGHAIAVANTQHHDLCRSDQDTAGAGMMPLMETDSETLMIQGIATGVAGLAKLRNATGWANADIHRTVCHQVGGRHRAAMLQAMGLPIVGDSITFPALGNTGSVALPISVAAAAASGQLSAGDRVAMLGIGSGINSVMLGTTWGETVIAGEWAGLLDELAQTSIADQAKWDSPQLDLMTS